MKESITLEQHARMVTLEAVSLAIASSTKKGVMTVAIRIRKKKVVLPLSNKEIFRIVKSSNDKYGDCFGLVPNRNAAECKVCCVFENCKSAKLQVRTFLERANRKE